MEEQKPTYLSYRPSIPETPAEYSETSLRIIKEMIAEALVGIGITANQVRNCKVMLKPNLVRPNLKAQPTVSTDPRVVIGLCEILKDWGARITVGENPGYNFSARAAFRAGELVWPLKRMDIGISFFDEELPVRVENPKGVLLRWIFAAKSLVDSELLLNVPKLKTHMHTLVSISLKNLQGVLLDSQRRLFHREDINQKIVDTAQAFRPWLNVVDGLWAMEGQAPFFGNSLSDFNVILAGQDILHTDCVATKLMGIDPREVSHLRIASVNGFGSLGSDRQQVLGCEIADRRRLFRRPVIGSTGLFPQIHVIEGGVCSGCLSSLRHSLDRLEFERRIAGMNECTVYLGKIMPNVSTIRCWNGTLWLMGNCAADLVFSHPKRRLQPRFLPGCPPHVLDFYNAIVAETS